MGSRIRSPRPLRNLLRSPTGRANLAALALVLLLLPGWGLAGRWYEGQLLTEERARVASQAADHANALSLAINRRLARLQGLHAFVLAAADNPDLAEEFLIFAADMQRESQGLRNIALAPNGVIQHVFPLAGNEAAVGYEPGLDPRPEVRTDVEFALATDKPVLTGPIELVQGGVGLTGRQPVFIDGEYWGLVNIVVDFNVLLADAGLLPLPAELSLGLSNAADLLIYGEPEALQADPVLQRVALSDSYWTLALAPVEGWQASVAGETVTFRGGSLLILLLIAALVRLTVNRQARLAAEVEQRTREVRQVNEQLRQDILARKRLEQELEAQVRARTQELASLLEISSKVGSTLELEELLEVILDELKQVVDYSSARISFLEKGQVEVGAVRGSSPGAPKKGDILPLTNAIVDRVVMQGQTVMIGDTHADQPPAREYRAQFDDTDPWSAEAPRSYLALPLRVKGRVVGALGLDHQRPDSYGPKQVELASAFANQVATAIENAQLFAGSRKLAVVEERNRLARELHDSVTQLLYSLTLFAEAARRAVAAGDQRLADEHLSRLRETARQSLKEMRLLVYQLRTSPLEGHGLSEALEARLDAVEKRAGVAAELSVEGVARLNAQAQDELYWIAQEALNNALKHSGADQVSLRLIVAEGGAEFVVKDNGGGFDPHATRPGGMGLGGMAERVGRLGGSLEIDSAPGSGTRLIVRLGQQALADQPVGAASHG